MKLHRCLNETTHRRTYNLVRKELYADCSWCAWHPTFWKHCLDNPFVHLMYMEEDTGKIKNHPNWKLVSRNRKQWMKKHFFTVRRARTMTGIANYYGW